MHAEAMGGADVTWTPGGIPARSRRGAAQLPWCRICDPQLLFWRNSIQHSCSNCLSPTLSAYKSSYLCARQSSLDTSSLLREPRSYSALFRHLTTTLNQLSGYLVGCARTSSALSSARRLSTKSAHRGGIEDTRVLVDRARHR
ncbi:hypothetical protein OH77DRAFT_1153172 [Trametes cingulata]|nr:hypothetical protein OH77DRAFT_1153172 [Trametes cingulata]